MHISDWGELSHRSLCFSNGFQKGLVQPTSHPSGEDIAGGVNPRQRWTELQEVKTGWDFERFWGDS